jgi:GNAT superfamily N-acetyltransferase
MGREEWVEPFGLYIGEQLVGYGELWTDDAEAEVELARLIIDPDERGKGLGQRLVTELADLARSRYPGVFLRIHPGNLAAQRCYAAAGFTPVEPHQTAEWNVGQPFAYSHWPAVAGHWLQHATHAGPSGALGSDKRQHVGGPDLIGRLADHREEHLQVIRRRQHRVRPAPPAQELQIHISQRHPDPDHQPAGPIIRTNHTQASSTHRLSSHHHRQSIPSRVDQITRKITGITCMSGRWSAANATDRARQLRLGYRSRIFFRYWPV